MAKSIQKSLIQIVLGPILVLVVMLCLSLMSIQILSNLSTSILHGQKVENAAQDVLVQFLNLETGLRGYIASHDSAFLVPYWEGEQKIGNLISKLGELTVSVESQSKSVKVLGTLFTDWFSYSKQIILDLNKTPRSIAPPAAFLNGTGRILMDKVHLQIHTILSTEESFHSAEIERAKRSVQWAMYSSLGLAILLGVLLAFRLRNQILSLARTFSKSLEESRSARNELRLLNDKLEIIVKERTAELVTTNAELEAFCYSVSHDLRAPLRGIDGFSAALLEDYSTSLAPEAQSFVGYIRQGVQRMDQLIEALLALSKLTRSEMALEEFDLGELSKEVESEMELLHPTRKVTFTGLDRAKVKGDRPLLRAVITNLLSNAWKFTEKVAKPEIQFGSIQQNGKQVFFVKDNGAGFDMGHAQNLFGAFQRLHPTKDYPGNGVGLATVRRIIRRLGGDVWAEGKTGEGATFFFTLAV